jgi:hypothetical protein
MPMFFSYAVRKDSGIHYHPIIVALPFVAVALFRLWLVKAQHLTALGGALHDDRLFLDNAVSLLKGNWLGAYNNLTLAKGPFYPFWIAAMSKLGVPLLLSQHLLYVTACAMFVIAAKPILRVPGITFPVFVALLFNPMSFSEPMTTQVIREGIYPALTLLVVSCVISLLVRADSSVKILALWAAGLGLVLSAFLLIREEGIWIFPFLCIIAGAAVLRMRKRHAAWKILCIIALPFFLSGALLGGVAAMNKARYGSFAVSELKTPEFRGAYGALLRISHDNRKPAVLVPREVRSRLYEVSPAFAELKPFLEGDIGKRWLDVMENTQKLYEKDPEFAKRVRVYLDGDPTGIWERVLFDTNRDLMGGWFIWAFRDSVAAAGYHSSGATAAAYYRRLAAEVNGACAEGRLSCLGERSSLAPPWRDSYTPLCLKAAARGARAIVWFDWVNVSSNPSAGDEKSLQLFRDITGERLSLSEFPVQVGSKDAAKLDVLNWIGGLYQTFMPISVLLSLIAFAAAGISVFGSSRERTVLIITASVLVAVAARLALLSVIHVTSFPAIVSHYLAPLYPLVILFVALLLSDSGLRLRDTFFLAKKEAGA